MAELPQERAERIIIHGLPKQHQWIERIYYRKSHIDGGVMTKCPFCGSGVHVNENQYTCGTWTNQNEIPGRSSSCYNRQIAILTASRDRWKKLAMSLNKIIATLALPNTDKELVLIEGEIADNAIAAIKTAGEWEE
jgi:hypothetical protein